MPSGLFDIICLHICQNQQLRTSCHGIGYGICGKIFLSYNTNVKLIVSFHLIAVAKGLLFL